MLNFHPTGFITNPIQFIIFQIIFISAVIYAQDNKYIFFQLIFCTFKSHYNVVQYNIILHKLVVT